MRQESIFWIFLILSFLLMASVSDALQIRDPAVIPDSTGTKTTVSCALCHKEPLGKLWHRGIDYEMEMPEGQHTRRVQASILIIWQSLTVTSEGMEKAGQLLWSIAKSEQIDVSALEDRLRQCERDFYALTEKPATTEEQLLEKTSLIGLKAQKVYLEEEKLRGRGAGLRAMGAVMVGAFAVLISILVGQLGMYAEKNEKRTETVEGTHDPS